MRTLEDDERERLRKIIQLAQDTHQKDGELEVDMPVTDTDLEESVSDGDDGGAYVRAWVWVSFADHPELNNETGSAS
jgi:hypothetical protein